MQFKEFEIQNITDYVKKIHGITDEVELDAFFSSDDKQSEITLAEEYIAMQYALVFIRRMPYVCGSISDTLFTLLCKKRDELNDLLGENFHLNINPNLDY